MCPQFGGGSGFIKAIDVSRTSEAINQFKDLISEMNGVDLVVISSGVGFVNHDLQWAQEKETIDVNVSGFTAMSNVAMHHFLSKGSGHLVGISSIVAIRGDGDAPAYNASKAFISNYMAGLRKKVSKNGSTYCHNGYSTWLCRHRNGKGGRAVLGGILTKSSTTNL